MANGTPHSTSPSPAPSSTTKRNARTSRKQFKPPPGWAESKGYNTITVHTAKCDMCNKHAIDENPIKLCRRCMTKICWYCESEEGGNGLTHNCLMEQCRRRPKLTPKSIAPSRITPRHPSAAPSVPKRSPDESITPDSHPHLYPAVDPRDDSGERKKKPTGKRPAQDMAADTSNKQPRLDPQANPPIGKTRPPPLPANRGPNPFIDGAYDHPRFEQIPSKHQQIDRRRPILPNVDASTMRTGDEFWNALSSCSQDDIANIKRQVMWMFELQPRHGPNEMSYNPEAEGKIKREFYSGIFMNAGFAMTSTAQKEFKALQAVQNQVDQRLQALSDSFMHADGSSPPPSAFSIEPAGRPGHPHPHSSYGPFNQTPREMSPARGQLPSVGVRYASHNNPAGPDTFSGSHAVNPYARGYPGHTADARGRAAFAAVNTAGEGEYVGHRGRSMSINNMLNEGQEPRSRGRQTEAPFGAGYTY